MLRAGEDGPGRLGPVEENFVIEDDPELVRLREELVTCYIISATAVRLISVMVGDHPDGVKQEDRRVPRQLEGTTSCI